MHASIGKRERPAGSRADESDSLAPEPSLPCSRPRLNRPGNAGDRYLRDPSGTACSRSREVPDSALRRRYSSVHSR